MEQSFGRAAGVLAFSLVTLLVTGGCGKKDAGPAERPPAPVTTVMVQARDVPVDFEYVAQTESSRQVNIQARVTGFLDKRVYTEGGLVREGQTLFVMDQKPFKTQVDQAQAALASNQAAHATARANLDRIKPLTQLNALSQKDLDDATGTYLTTQAQVEQAKAQLETAKLNLSYATITTPVTGLAGSAQQADGTYINPSNSLLTTVYVLSPMWVNFSISENENQSLTDQVKQGRLRVPKDDKYEIEVLLVDGTPFAHTGRITFAAPNFDPQTGTFQVRASVNNPDGHLRPNQFVRVKMKGAVRPNAILVPQRAVQQGAKSHFVWVVKDGKAEYRPVQVGSWYGDDWFITTGLQAGEEVVVDGVMTLAPGAAVSPKPMAAAVPAGATKAVLAPAAAAPAGPAATAAAPAAAVAPPPVQVVTFASGAAAVEPAARTALASLATQVKSGNQDLELSGFVDSRGKPAANQDLAKRRARAVRDVLEDAGLPSNRIRLIKPVAVVGGDDAAARRVEIRIVAAAAK
ncbi:MAG: efflux RND transporter periplasmic adaptor subunit [Burkholderiaceae bacterium]